MLVLRLSLFDHLFEKEGLFVPTFGLDGDLECGALHELTFDVNGAAHRRNNLVANRKP